MMAAAINVPLGRAFVKKTNKTKQNKQKKSTKKTPILQVKVRIISGAVEVHQFS